MKFSGLSDWAQEVTDEVAAAGYVAVAPDLLTGMAPSAGRAKDFPGDSVTEAISKLDPDQITADLNAAADFVLKLPASNGKLYAGGFCWGGGQTFAMRRIVLIWPRRLFFTDHRRRRNTMSKITAPVYGFSVQGNDARIGATHPPTR